MILNIAICDDEQNASQYLVELLHMYEIQHDYDFKITTFHSAIELQNVYKTAGQYDILFLDVEMPELSGLDLARSVRNIPDSTVKIIFTSNYPQYMQDSFNVNAFQYLQKPITLEQLHEQFHRIVNELQFNTSAFITVKNSDKEELLPINEILYIETIKKEKDKLLYVCRNKELIGQGKIIDLEHQLQTHHFSSPHRGILVNLRAIHFITSDTIEMVNGAFLPLSRRKEKEFRQHFHKILLS
jgi:DNA-binding LytR/AlgR family response regulator